MNIRGHVRVQNRAFWSGYVKYLLPAALFVVLFPSFAHAEPITVSWSLPIQLSSDDKIVFPTVALDPYGGVHVFWSQGREPGTLADMIMTVHWDGSAWSAPNDIFVAPAGSGLALEMPRATTDSNGKIYLVWVAGGTVYFSSTFAPLSSDAQAWTAPIEAIEVEKAYLPQIVVDNQGTIHIVVTDSKAGGNVWYTQSIDGGANWTSSVPVSTVELSAMRVPDNPQLVTDQEGIIHVFWSENYPPEYIGRELYYARSVDGGTTWSLPSQLSYSESQDDWEARPTVAVDSSEYIHVVWVCGQATRCYRVSQDRGESWSDTQALFAPLVGTAGWDAMVADDYGSVYWVGTMRYPQAFYGTVFEETQWREPPVSIISEVDWGGVGEAHRPQAVIGLGNQLHVVMVENDAGPVWYIAGITSEPAIAPLPVPTSLQGSAAVAETNSIRQATVVSVTHTPVSTVVRESTLRLDSFPRTPPATMPLNSTAVSLASVVVTLVAVMAVVIRRRRQ